MRMIRNYIYLLSLIMTKKLKVVWSLAYLTCTTGFLLVCNRDKYNFIYFTNMLVCNRDKSNFIYFTSKFHNHTSSFTISFGSSVLHPVNTVRYLGVNWDKHLLMRSNISKCCQLASFSLNRLGALQNYVDKFSMERLVHAFISSRLDYCNALLYGVPAREINRLQNIKILQRDQSQVPGSTIT